MPFELIVAFRFLREGRFQTVLILSGVAVGAAVIVFLVALITGLQDDLIARTLGTQPHIVLRPPDDVARSVLRAGGRARRCPPRSRSAPSGCARSTAGSGPWRTPPARRASRPRRRWRPARRSPRGAARKNRWRSSASSRSGT